MAINKKLIHFNTLEKFKENLKLNADGSIASDSNILGTSIVFIKDAKLIWTHGQYYGSTDEIQSQLNDLTDTVSENELVTAAALVDLEEKKLDANQLSSLYSEDPQVEYKKLGGNNVYEKFFTLSYTTPGTETTWELPCTSETSGVIVLKMDCILKQSLGNEGQISFDYRDHYLFGDNANILKYYYKHDSGSLIIKFVSNVITTLTGLFKFSCSSAISGGNSSSTTSEEIIDGGTSV